MCACFPIEAIAKQKLRTLQVAEVVEKYVAEHKTQVTGSTLTPNHMLLCVTGSHSKVNFEILSFCILKLLRHPKGLECMLHSL